MGKPEQSGVNESGRSEPCWYVDADVGERAGPSENAKADVVVVGAGIAGLMAAYFLAKAGKSVVVLDEKQVGGGETGRTSAHLASAIDDRFAAIEKNLGRGAACVQYESHARGIDLIEQIAREEGIACDFARVDGYLYGAEGGSPEALDEECEAARRAGFSNAGVLDRPRVVGVVGARAIRFPNQARFHPLKFVSGLAGVVEKMGVRIFCGKRVTDLSGDGPVTARLAGGLHVRAEWGIAATNVPTPINNWAGVYTKQVAWRTYVVGLEVPTGSITDALYWDMEDPYHYARLHVTKRSFDERTLLLVGGEDHRVGNGESKADQLRRFEALEAWARRHFLVGRTGDGLLGPVAVRWSGQVAEPDDGVAFIGRVPTREHGNCFVITGDSGMGLTGGALGAKLVSELILKGSREGDDAKVHPWAELYSPSRKPVHSLSAAVEFVKENAAAAGTLREYLTAGEVSSTEEILPGSGAIVRRGLSKVAAYRDEAGKVHECSAICTHLKCIVRWNGLEKSWDCPCHGSRFDAYGKVIIGPAVEDLPKTDASGG